MCEAVDFDFELICAKKKMKTYEKINLLRLDCIKTPWHYIKQTHIHNTAAKRNARKIVILKKSDENKKRI